METNSQMLSPDKPLSNPELDRFSYAPVAQKLATSIHKMSPPEGLVIGIYGEWGLGKSTFIEFVIHYLEQAPKGERPVIMRFNPWWFSGSENLVRHFFDQLQITLGNNFPKRVANLVETVRKFSDVVAEVPLPGAGVAKAIADTIPDINQRDVISLKNEIAKKLEKEGKRIVVIIDDIDRLNPEEIRQLFTVIKAIADFPNMIYLVGFDREIVADAFETKGSEFLEKIVQVSFDLPRPSSSQLEALFLENIMNIFGELPQEFAVNKYLKSYGYLTQLGQILNTPRKVARITNALHVTYAAVKNEVNHADFVVIEIIRLFYPELYDVIRSNKELFLGKLQELNKSFYSNLITANKYPDFIDELLQQLFPRLSGGYGYDEQELRQRLRIASPDIFDTYFTLTVPTDRISNAELKTVLAAAYNPITFSQELNRYFEKNPERLHSLLVSIGDYSRKDIPQENVSSIIEAILDIGDKFCGFDELGFFDLIGKNEYELLHIITTLLRRLERHQQFLILKEPLTKGKSNFLAIELVILIEHLHERFIDKPSNFHNENDEILKITDIPALEEIALKKIQNVIERSDFFSRRDVRTILYLWIYIQADEAHKWIDKKLRDPSRLIDFIRNFFDIARSSLSETYELDEIILLFVDLKTITDRIKDILRLNILESDQIKVANAFLSASDKLQSKNA